MAKSVYTSVNNFTSNQRLGDECHCKYDRVINYIHKQKRGNHFVSAKVLILNMINAVKICKIHEE